VPARSPDPAENTSFLVGSGDPMSTEFYGAGSPAHLLLSLRGVLRGDEAISS
jgi:hypothetical protein